MVSGWRAGWRAGGHDTPSGFSHLISSAETRASRMHSLCLFVEFLAIISDQIH